ncbi:MAG: hypothetical protein K0S04_1304 [Herbinix sp.]|jgi:hypothetical protein|nr:hypothetical protein [Herbinix sp.]
MENKEQLIHSMKATMELIEETTDLFYQQKQQVGLQNLENMIASIMVLLENVQKYQMSQHTIILEEIHFNSILVNAMDILAQKDYVLLADILTFELNGVIENSLRQLRVCADS